MCIALKLTIPIDEPILAANQFLGANRAYNCRNLGYSGYVAQPMGIMRKSELL